MLTACIWAEYKLGTVDPFWDPLSPEHGLPRNLVFVIAVVLCFDEKSLVFMDLCAKDTICQFFASIF
ncbi:MAG TPA: hypothetical protein DD387_01085 [Lachnoclostridium sp.]|nr:hypothetical protein [Lachnoclostridium sp.]